MPINMTALSLLLMLALSFPLTAQAFWWSDGDNRSGLNLESGYDANTVTTVTGRILSVQSGEDQRHVQLELESGGAKFVVVLGPKRFWADNGIELKVGDNITVRGSKAQGKDGVVYILAQKINNTTRDTEISLRNDSGRPLWSGGGAGRGAAGNAGRTTPLRQQSPGRLGGGRMGR
ncbi:MAG: hypothetical protein RW306_09140 [Geobacteraceae bacterium]|nr:hypothetical protein [Geobacteraceae bacterium]